MGFNSVFKGLNKGLSYRNSMVNNVLASKPLTYQREFWLVSTSLSAKPHLFRSDVVLLFLPLFTYLLIPWSRVLLEKLTGLQPVKKFPAFYGTRRFIAAFTSSRQLSLSWASSIQSISPHPTSWRSILISSFPLRLGLASGLFPSGFPTKTLYRPLLFPIYTACPFHPSILDLNTRKILGEQYRSLSSTDY